LKWEEILPFFAKKEKKYNDFNYSCFLTLSSVFQDDVEGTEDFQGQTYKSEFATFAPDHISEGILIKIFK